MTWLATDPEVGLRRGYSAADASIACWDAKYTYNFWRPFPAIFNGEADGNPATSGDAAWLPLLPTPPHPEYPSGHTTNSGAMTTIIRLLFGDAPGVPIQLTFQELVEARVYSGVHFRTADEVGARQGGQVARFVMTHALRPTRGVWRSRADAAATEPVSIARNSIGVLRIAPRGRATGRGASVFLRLRGR